MNRCLSWYACAGLLTSLAGLRMAAGADAAGETATCAETRAIGASGEGTFGSVSTLCMNGDGNLLVGDTKTMAIKVVGPAGNVLDSWTTPVKPVCIHWSTDGTVYVGGVGELAKFDQTGKVLKVATAADAAFPNSKVSGIATTATELFVAFGSPGTLRSVSKLVRFDRDFGQGTVIAEDLRGCCQHLDIAAQGDVLYVGENARHRVVKYDRTGKLLATWGERSRGEVGGFGSCCNPMNLCFGADGSLYTAESGLGRVKRYTPDGRFEELVGYVGVARFDTASELAASCANMCIAVSKDTNTVFVLDYKGNQIRVLTRK